MATPEVPSVTSRATLRARGQEDSWLKMFGVPNAFAKVSRKASLALGRRPTPSSSGRMAFNRSAM